MLVREGDEGDERIMGSLLAALGTGHVPFCGLTRLQLIPPHRNCQDPLHHSDPREEGSVPLLVQQLSFDWDVVWELRCFL